MELEVVVFSKYVTYKIHMIDIFLGKVYALHKNVLYQDSKREIKMNRNWLKFMQR